MINFVTFIFAVACFLMSDFMNVLNFFFQLLTSRNRLQLIIYIKMSQNWSHGTLIKGNKNGIQFKLNLGFDGSLINGTRLSSFLQIWIRKYVYILNLTWAWSDTICTWQNMHWNAPGGQILNFQNTFGNVCDKIRLEIQSRKFPLCND